MKKQNRLLSLILSLFLLLFTLVPQSALTVKAEGNSEMAVHFIDVGHWPMKWQTALNLTLMTSRCM